MNKKIISIFVSMLLCVTVFSVTGAMNVEKTVNMKTQSATTDIVWFDDFDNYTLYQFLDGTPDDGGWKGWDDSPAVGATVTGNQSLSSPHSVDIVGPTDLVHEYSGYSSGIWTFIAWVYVPGDTVGNSYFILLSYYAEDNPGANSKWAVQMWFDPVLEIVTVDDGDELDLITDQWVEIRVEIDLGADWHQVFYDGLMLYEKAWTAGPFNQGDGLLDIAAVDLFANSATSVYYDDLSLEGEAGEDPDLFCEGDLHFGNVSAGATLTDSFTVKNVGGGLLDWKITDEPSWGTWTFDPESGDDLPPATPVTVQVTVVAPKEKEDWVSTITVTNMENPDDTCTIDVSMTTPVPVSQPSLFLQFLERLIQRFPVLEMIFSHLLG